MTVTLQHVLVFAALLFAVGSVGAVTRRNVLIVFMSIEIMFGGALVALLAFARWNLLPEGMAAALFILVIMAAEAAVGLALVVALARSRRTLFVDELNVLRG